MDGLGKRIGALVDGLCRRHETRLRRSLADSLERAVAEVDEPLRRWGAAVPIDRPAVAEAAPLLLQIAARLRAPEPLPLVAVGLVRSLVGAGPLYSSSPHRSEYPPGTLVRSARAILVACRDRAPAPGRGELIKA